MINQIFNCVFKSKLLTSLSVLATFEIHEGMQSIMFIIYHVLLKCFVRFNYQLYSKMLNFQTEYCNYVISVHIGQILNKTSGFNEKKLYFITQFKIIISLYLNTFYVGQNYGEIVKC